jgi:hypothetical protein
MLSDRLLGKVRCHMLKAKRSFATVILVTAFTLGVMATPSLTAASSFTSLLDLQVSFGAFTPASVSITAVGGDTIFRAVRITEGVAVVSSFNPGLSALVGTSLGFSAFVAGGAGPGEGRAVAEAGSVSQLVRVTNLLSATSIGGTLSGTFSGTLVALAVPGETASADFTFAVLEFVDSSSALFHAETSRAISAPPGQVLNVPLTPFEFQITNLIPPGGHTDFAIRGLVEGSATSPVPEPATLLLWGSTMAGMGLAWRRRRGGGVK